MPTQPPTVNPSCQVSVCITVLCVTMFLDRAVIMGLTEAIQCCLASLLVPNFRISSSKVTAHKESQSVEN